jgi:multidrug efflux pump subunit AcrA (membrane-fusion protein)
MTPNSPLSQVPLESDFPSSLAPTNLESVLAFILNLQRSLDLHEVANVVVNDTRLLWCCDRVSLALQHHRKTIVAAVSGQESVHPRGNLVRAMSRLSAKVIESGEPLIYDGRLEDLPPPLEAPLADYIQEAGPRYLLIVPLFKPVRLVAADRPDGSPAKKHSDEIAIGALVIEQMNSSQPTPQLQYSLDHVIGHVSAAIYNSQTHGSIFLLPLWRAIGRGIEWLQGRRLAIAIALLITLSTICGLLVVVPWEYRVDATGRLMPVIQREVFAPWDGQIVELKTAGGERVEAGEVLLKLRNDELVTELVTTENKLLEKRKLVHSLHAQHEVSERQGNREEAAKLQGRIVESSVEIEGATLQLKVLRERLERMTVRAPIGGIVTTFQVEHLLLNRPVKRGDVLIEVMDDNGDWQLEVEIAEQRVGRVLQAQQRLHLENNTRHRSLPIEYRLLTQPESSYSATLGSLATRTATTESTGSVLQATAALEKARLPTRAIGAEVRARIGCGTSTLGDVLLGDVIEFVWKYLWW